MAPEPRRNGRRESAPPCWRRPSWASSGDLRRDRRGRRRRGLFPDRSRRRRRAGQADRPEPPIADIPEDAARAARARRPRTLLVLGSDRRAKNSIDAKLSAQRRVAALGHDRARPPRSEAQPDRRALAPARSRGDDPGLRRQHEDQPGLRRGRRAPRRSRPSSTCSRTRPARSSRSTASSTSTSTASSEAVNYVKGVYVDVDRDYNNPEGTGFASIDIKAGYQRLVGSDALAYVRYRHTDSDIFRNARQQEFLRQASNQPAVEKLKSVGEARDFLGVMLSYFRFDKNFLDAQEHRRDAQDRRSRWRYNHAPVNQIALAGDHRGREPDRGHAALPLQRQPQGRLRRVHDRRGHAQPEAREEDQEGQEAGQGVDASAGSRTRAGWARTSPCSPTPRLKKLPFYFPEYRTTGSRYANETPRIYSERDEQGKLYRAYRIVVSNGAPGEYYGVQGRPGATRRCSTARTASASVNGRKLMLFYDGSKLRQVAWKTPRAVYWVTNTLNRKLSNAQMLAIAGSLRRLDSRLGARLPPSKRVTCP